MFFKQTYIIQQHETALLFHEGKLVETLTPGKHVRWGRDYALHRFDLRAQTLTVSGQEVPSSDGISIRASANVTYRIVDAERVYESSVAWYSEAYSIVHEAVRDVITVHTADQALANRAELNAQFTELVTQQLTAIGLQVDRAKLSDVGVSGEIKRAFGQLIVAQKEAQAALERARAETATLRALANAAKLAQENPELLQLRLLRVLEQKAGSRVAVKSNDLSAAWMQFE